MREMKDSGVSWIGEIPTHWALGKVGMFYNVVLGKMLQPDQNRDSDTYETYLCAANLGNNTLKYDVLKQMWFSEKDRQQYEVQKGDLIVVEGGDVASCDIIRNEVKGLYIQNALHRVRTKKDFSLEFLRYSLMMAKAQGYISLICNKATIAHFTKDKFISLPFLVVPVDEQLKIVQVLDEKCAQVDTLIANVQAQIEKLKAYKQSLITEVVTKGLDPATPMKDSGVEWIGEIPAHWEVTRIKNKFALRNERNDEADLAKVNLISLYTDLGVVQHSDLTATTGNRAVTAEGYKMVHKNDIVVNIILCWMGAVGMSKYDGVTSPAYDIYRPLEGTNSDYYHYLFRTTRFNGECYRYGRGIMMMRWRTYSTEFSAINIPCPPEDEQREIIAFLEEKCNQVDRIIAIKQSKIEKLEQYKRSLIYEYVTGKKEVPAHT